MQTEPRFIMIGGFLGAGKTTTISRLAKHYQSQGKRVVIVTNDQASDLVDTLLLRSQGFDVGEVAGSCFCCNFNELTGAVESLSVDKRPDIILAEPVGSCTDLVATVIRPLEQIYNQKFDIAPYGVIIKPSHGFRILGEHNRRGFSPQAEYIFKKQIEEADFVIINRIDELPEEQVERIEELLKVELDNRPIVRMSAATGQGIDDLILTLEQDHGHGSRSMEVDYDLYAEGEAELGWLNCQAQLQSDEAFNLDQLLLEFLARIANSARDQSAEVAHLKAIGMVDGAQAVANVISNEAVPVLSLASSWSGKAANLVVNARIATSPESLTALVEKSATAVGSDFSVRISIEAVQSFRPGRPIPTHRITQ